MQFLHKGNNELTEQKLWIFAYSFQALRMLLLRTHTAVHYNIISIKTETNDRMYDDHIRSAAAGLESRFNQLALCLNTHNRKKCMMGFVVSERCKGLHYILRLSSRTQFPELLRSGLQRKKIKKKHPFGNGAKSFTFSQQRKHGQQRIYKSPFYYF